MTSELVGAALSEEVGNGDSVTNNCINGDSSASSQSEFLACSLCHRCYTQPKLLPCLHTFCKQCIDSDTPSHSLSVACPLCRHQSILPPDGIDALHDNTYVAQMTQFVGHRQRCVTCSSEGLEKCSTHSSCEDLQLSKLKLVCRSHEGQLLTQYCHDCETVYCGICSEHTDHKSEIMTMNTVASQLSDLRLLIHSSLEGKVVELRQVLDTIRAVDNNLTVNHAEAHQSICDTFDSLVQCIQRRREIILTELNDVFTQKDQILKSQAHELNQLLLSVTSSCDFTLKSLEETTCDPTEVLIGRRELTDRLTELCSSSVPTPAETDNLSFDVLQNDIASIENVVCALGVIGTGGAVPFETTVAGDGTRQCWPNKPATVTITARDRHGALVRVGHSAFTAMIMPSTSSSKTVHDAFINEITDNADGTYDLSFIVRQPGTFLLEIKLRGHQVRGSPFRIRAHHETTNRSSRPRPKSDSRFESSPSIGGSSSAGGSGSRGTKNPSSSHSQGSQRRGTPVEDDLMLRVGTQGRNKGEFLNPQGVAFYHGNGGGRVLIADSNSQCIQVFNASSGECILKFGTKGRLAGQLQRPTGVAVSPSGNYLVADYDNKWIGIYSSDGKYISRIGVGKLLGPKGICCDSNGRVIVVDNRGSCIYIFQPNGRLVSKFGSRSTADPRHLAGPHFCALTPSGRDIVITDFHNHCVKVFDLEDGSMKFSFGSAGEGNGQFGAPTGVTVDRNGNILVADWGNNRIQVFDSEGSFLSFVNTTADPLYGPQGLAFTDDGNILVADSGNHCYKIYRHLI